MATRSRRKSGSKSRSRRNSGNCNGPMANRCGIFGLSWTTILLILVAILLIVGFLIVIYA